MIKLLFILTIFNINSFANSPIRVTGSSTVFPFVAYYAEQFASQNNKFESPIVETVGTGGGFHSFCTTTDPENAPDIVNASREITEQELNLCNSNGIKNIEKITLGLDAVVLSFGSFGKFKELDLKKHHIFLALSKLVPINGKLVENPYKKWKEIDPSLPDENITIYGPSSTSGTYDSFVEIAMVSYCQNLPEFKAIYSDKKTLITACSSIRHDGIFLESGENDSAVIRKLLLKRNSIGIFGYNYYSQNKDILNVVAVEGIIPSEITVASGKYPISRSLFVYFSTDSLTKKDGLSNFLSYILSQTTNGSKGRKMSDLTLVPLQKQEAISQYNRLTKIISYGKSNNK